MSANRFYAYGAEHDEGPYEVVLASDYDSLLAVLRRCVDWMEEQFCPEDTNCDNCAAGRMNAAAARAVLEEKE